MNPNRILFLLTLLLLGSCASLAPVRSQVLVENKGTLSITLHPGKNFSSQGWFGPFPFTKGPQMAVWATDLQGNYLATLLVTEKAAKHRWLASEVDRVEALPVWSHAQAGDAPDAVTAATDQVQAKVVQAGYTLPFKFRLFVEVNHSYDWNAVWKKDLPVSDPRYNGVNGQPSLVSRALVDLDDPHGEVVFQVVGHGSATGADGVIDGNLAGMDSARDILDRIEVTRAF